MMLRNITAMAIALALVGCGSQGADFAIKIKRSPDAVLAELAKMNPNSMMNASDLRPIASSRPDANSLLYTLPASDGYDDGTFLFALKPAGEGDKASVVEVTVDLPYITRQTGSNAQFLDESAVESELKKSLKRLGSKMSKGESTQIALNDAAQMISIAGVALQDFDGYEQRAEAALMSEFLARAEDAPSADWGGGDSWAEEPGDSAYAGSDDYYVEEAPVDDVATEGGGWGDGAY